MLENILEKIEIIVKNKKILDNQKLEKLKKTLKGYKYNEYIYPGVLIRRLNITADTAYILLKELENENILSKSYEEYCLECGKVNGKIHDSFADIPDEIYCNDCGDELDIFNNMIVIYRVKV